MNKKTSLDVSLGTFLKYIEFLLNNDTWDKIKRSKGYSTAVAWKIIKYGIENKFIKPRTIIERGRAKTRYDVIMGTYDILLNGRKYKISLSKKGNKVNIVVSYDIETEAENINK